MSASAVQAWISGPGYFAQARNFEEVRGFATAGGQDYATLYAGNTSDSWIKNSEFAQLVTSDTRVRSAMGFEKIDTFDATVAVKVATLATLDHTSPSISSADSSFDTYTANPVVAAAEERAAALLASSQPMRLPDPAIFPRCRRNWNARRWGISSRVMRVT